MACPISARLIVQGVRVVACSFVILGIGFAHAQAQAQQLFGSTGLDSSFCQQKTFRQTVVYVDDLSIQQGQTSWAKNLEDKLRATLTPGEQVTVVELSPGQGTSQEIWHGCYPDYSSTTKQKFAAKTYLFTSNPLNGLKAQQGYFFNAFGHALTVVFQNAEKVHPVEFDATEPSSDQLIEALASDGARFSQSSELVRAIVFSNLAQNSSLGNVFNHSAPPSDVGQKLGTYFRHSVFYFFGVGSGVKNDQTYFADSKDFWASIMGSMDAPIDGFGSDLNVANAVPITSYRYNLKLTLNGTQLFGKASLLTDADGNLIDSWAGIDRLSFVGLSGTFVCSDANNSGCVLNATTSNGLTTKSASEELQLSGTDYNALKGTDGVQGALTFPMTANLANQ